MTMKLPEAIVPAQDQNPGTILLFGEPKVGKTTVLAELGTKILIVDLEKGTRNIDAQKINPENMEDFIDVGKQLAMYKKENGSYKYKYVAIDTVDVLEAWCETQAVKSYKATAIGSTFKGKSILELPNGAGYYHLRNEVLHWIKAFEGVCEHLILVCHVKDKLIGKGLEEVAVKDISLTGKLGGIVCAKADAIGYLYRSEKDDEGNSELMVSFETSDSVTCGARPAHLKGQYMPLKWSNIYK